MSVLILLLGILLIGLCCFLAQECGQLHTKPNATDLKQSRLNRSQLTKALDELLRLYQSGALTEEQYLCAADNLIDQLVVVFNIENSSLEGVSFILNDPEEVHSST